MYAIGQPMEANTTPTRAAYADDLYCPDCGYSLRGLTSDRCPECGLLLDFIESDRPLIPWELHDELGRIRAYWRTVFAVIGRPKRFCRAMYRAVSYRDAQAFRWITIAHACVAVVLVLATLYLLHPQALTEETPYAGWELICGNILHVFIVLAALTGIPSYFFHPAHLPIERQNRAVALSYYGTAPLALSLPIAPILIAILVVGRSEDTGVMQATALVPGVFATLTLALLTWWCWSALARYTLERISTRLLVTYVSPVLSAVVVWLIACGLPLIVGFIAVVLSSLQEPF
jgi:hypothetical protein